MLRSLKINDFMSRDVLALGPDMKVLDAVQLLIKKGYSGAPVLDKHGRLIGIFTERDYLREAVQAYYHGEPGGLVKEHMSTKPQHVDADQSILTVAELFIGSPFQRYPVLDNGRLVGIISRYDIMQALAKHYPT
jgi:CBS domain-containing protein